MNRLSLAVAIGLGAYATILSPRSAQFQFPNQTLTVPDGFEVERVASAPLVDRPVTADFDEQGRLYVTDSSGSNDKPDKQLQERPHRIVRLEDTNGDGRFDKSVVFADKMMFPEGCLWFDGSLYVAAPPSIWKLTDTDGDGVADRREEWFQGKTLTGCANDLHGPYLGPDGWLYWCKGAFATQTYERPGKPPFVTRAAHIFRARPDGSGIEPVLTGGMDNPVSVAFTPNGERILTGTFFVHPGGGQRDGLIHAIYGGVYGKDHDVLDGHKRTGDLMPIMTHHGPAASCFVIRYESAAFGEEYRDNLFACLFNLHKVVRHVLVPDGASFHTRDEDFLVSDNPDFHPTDVLEDADGSMLVVDTGGWYKICCPTSQLWKPDILGAIYRVRRKGASHLEDPRGLKLAWKEMGPAKLTDYLGDTRSAVRQRAMAALARQGTSAVPALAQCLSPSHPEMVRLNAVWTLTRIEGDAARQAVHVALQDEQPNVRIAALHSVALWRDHSAPQQTLVELLTAAPPPIQRVAAEAVGRLGDSTFVPPLLATVGAKSIDRVLEHSLIYALIEINDRNATAKALTAESSGTRRAALIALDQMDDGGLQPEAVTGLLGSSDPALKQTASWIVNHHPEWASALAGFFRQRLANPDLSVEDRTDLERQLGQFARDSQIQDLLVEVLREPGKPRNSRLTALKAMALAGLKEAPSAWSSTVAEILTGRDPALLGPALAAARAWSSAGEHRTASDHQRQTGSGSIPLAGALRAVAHDRSLPAELRLNALAALPTPLSDVDADLFDLLRSNLDPSQPVSTRSTAAAVLGKARLNTEQLLTLADRLKTVGPMEIPRVLPAFEKSGDETVGLKLVASLREASGLSGLRPDDLKSRLTNFPEKVQEASQTLLAQLNVDAATQKAHLDELERELKNGDVRRGQMVFNSQKAACSSCHAIGYLGGNVGPDLTRIGQVRTQRDLLESIVYPSASFVRSYEPVRVRTKSGDDYNGVVRKDTPEQLVLATGPGTEARIDRSDIEEIQLGTISIMPAGLDELLTRQELADLLAFLRATRW